MFRLALAIVASLLAWRHIIAVALSDSVYKGRFQSVVCEQCVKVILLRGAPVPSTHITMQTRFRAHPEPSLQQEVSPTL